ncbi:unnamed protein product [Camellia sinensis]
MDLQIQHCLHYLEILKRFLDQQWFQLSVGHMLQANYPLQTGTDFLCFREAWSLLHSAADVAGRSEILKAFPMHRTGRIRPNPESMFRVLSGMYFPGKQDRISGSARDLLLVCCCCCRCVAAEFCWAAAADAMLL